jgi:hypothetical protein
MRPVREVTAPRGAGRAGVRATIVAMKRRNGRGAKGRRKMDVRSRESPQERLTAVPTGAKQVGEAESLARVCRDPWRWAEGAVWTDRMLTALERGVKGDVWHSLIDKVWNRWNLWSAWSKSAKNRGLPAWMASRSRATSARRAATWSIWRRRCGTAATGPTRSVGRTYQKSYFDTIPHDRLMEVLGRQIVDSALLTLIERFLQAHIMEGLSTWKPESGAPQGAVLSPLLSNIYLNELDHLMVRNGREMVRYADDFVILCKTKEQAEAALSEVREWTARAGLTLHPEKTRNAEAATEGFEFLGYRFDKGKKWPRKKSLTKLQDKIREKTRRMEGRSMEAIVKSVNPVLRGWFAYFQHCGRNTFPSVDSRDTHASKKHPQMEARPSRPGPGRRSSTLAERLFQRTGPLFTERGP